MTGIGKYVVRVVGPTGLERYLTARFMESDDEKNAHRFTSAKAAGQFGELYFKIPRGLCCWDVQDITDPERGAINWDDDEISEQDEQMHEQRTWTDHRGLP